MRLFYNLIFFIFLLTNSQAQILKEIKIIGNDRLSENTIINFSELSLEETISEDILNNSLKKLYETDFFEDIQFNLKDGLLEIVVIELPLIQEIKINGIKANKTIKAIKDKISLKEKGPLKDLKIKQDLNTILNFFKSAGYYFVNVDPKIEKIDNNAVNLIFDIDRGDRASISEIEFIGDKVFKKRKLLSIITSEEDKFWKILSNKKFIDIERINLDKRLLLNFYRQNGYYKAEVKGTYSKIIEDKNFLLSFNVEAGEKFYFGNFSLNLPSDYDQEIFTDLLNNLNNLKSKQYNINLIEGILDDIEKITLNQNYDFIDANISEKIAGNNINFTIDIIESQKKFVKKINIFGNNITSEEFIRDNLLIDEGDPLNKILYNKSINNLRSKNLFKSVNSNILDENENFQIIEIDIEEKPTGEISAGAGYGSNGSSFGFSIKENNFNGKGISLQTSLSLSEDAVKGSFGFTHPNFAYTDRELSSSIESTSTDKLSDFGYKSNLKSFSVGTRYEQFENLYFSPEFSISSENIKVTSTASNAYKKQKGTFFETLFSYGLSYDTRNYAYQPTSGFLSNWYQSVPIVSDDKSLLNSYQISNYLELSDEIVLSTNFLVKSINSLSDKDVRVSKRLYIPSSRLRGFETGKVGPVDGKDFVGGNYVSTFNLSSTLPYLFQTIETIDMKLFFDAANVWGVDYSNSLDDNGKIRTSTGIGVDVLTPIGPLSFSLAQPLSKKSTDKTETFRFQLGTTF